MDTFTEHLGTLGKLKSYVIHLKLLITNDVRWNRPQRLVANLKSYLRELPSGCVTWSLLSEFKR